MALVAGLALVAGAPGGALAQVGMPNLQSGAARIAPSANPTADVGAQRQVTITAEIWRLSDNYDLDIGTQLRYTGQEGSIDFISSIFPAADITNGLEIITDLLSTSYGYLKAQINLAQRDGNAELLTSPKITVIDGQPAYFTASDRVPYRTLNTKGSIVTEYFNFGVTMEAKPTILDIEGVDDTFVEMEIKVEVSEVMAFREERSNQVQVPVASISQAKTNVVVKTGTSFFMGGLYREQEVDRKQGIPYLSAIPGIGKVFGNERTATERSQVIFSIRPVVITAEDQQGILPQVIDFTSASH